MAGTKRKRANDADKNMEKKGKIQQENIEAEQEKSTRSTRDAKSQQEEDLDVQSHEAEPAATDARQYWLMKAEPEPRTEKGVDVSFSIDDLKAAKEPEGWDGVRNYRARNLMRKMKKGDLAFFYHSNCKKPGIAGIMEIVKGASDDLSALDSKNPYFDPKSTKDKPKWSLVHVRFVEKFEEPVFLQDLREWGRPGGPLLNMELLRQSRLSVTTVEPEHWKFIMSKAHAKDR